MPENLLQKMIFALLSGIAEILPISAPAHQTVYRVMTGLPQNDAWLMAAIRLGVLTALFLCCKMRLKRLSREYRLSKRASRRRKNLGTNPQALLDLRVLTTAMIPLLISVLFYKRAGEWICGLASIVLTMTLNGFILFLPRLMGQGNKNGRSMSRLDSVLMGLGGAFGAVPGLSRIAGTTTVGISRGVDRAYAWDTALILSIPVMLGLLVFDIYAVAVAEVSLTFLSALAYLLAALLSFGGAYIGIATMRLLSVKTGFTGFAYYCWGMALFTFILYLMI